MEFKKITNKHKFKNDGFTIDDVKMVKISFIFPVWKNYTNEDILSEFYDSDLYSIEEASLEEATPTIKDLEEFQQSFDGDWYFYHREEDITLQQIINNSKKKLDKK